ncbi:PEGA domain-containing protein [candidate division WOR-3 bacterium]|nr:PEGA domain-containing protein [candidate division WOR-3 bacterium]
MKKKYILPGLAIILSLIACQIEEVGWISITSTPRGANVSLNDSLTDETTSCVLEVGTGEHQLKLSLEDYLDWDSLVIVEVEETTLVNVTLVPMDSADTTLAKLKWKLEVGGEITRPAIGSDGTIYFGAFEKDSWGYLYAYNPDGTKKWEFDAGGEVTPPVISSNGNI